jgi:hemolysin activation/secretion protein
MVVRIVLVCLLGALMRVGGSTAWAQSAASGTLPSLETGNGDKLSEQQSIQVKGFSFEGNTVFSAKELDAVAESVIKNRVGGRASSEDLDEIRNRITLKYINAGYINSGAILPDQKVVGGIIHYKIVEGKLSEIRVTYGNPATQPSAVAPPVIHFLRDEYVINRVKVGEGPPLNINDLKNQLDVLRQEPNIASLNAQLTPGEQPGESVLDVDVTERNPFQFGLQFGNPRSPSVGAYEMDAFFSDSDLLGFGDSLAFRYGLLTGPSNDLQQDTPKDYSIDYNIPVTRYDTTFDFNYARSSDLIVEPPFNAADIKSSTTSYAGWLTQPIIHQPNREFDLSIGATGRYNTTYLSGQPFSLAPGADDGSSNAFAIRFAQEFNAKSDNRSIAVRSVFGFGINGPGSTINGSEPESRFTDWLGQAQYARRLPGMGLARQSDGQAILRFNAQLSANRLLDVEQYGLGGMDTVRGYRQDQLVSDNALAASLEIRIPLIEKAHMDVLDVAPFFDAGYAWNARNYSMSPQLISAPGVGLLLNLGDHFSGAVYYGYALKHFQQTTRDLQDSGIDFTVTLSAF